jgi:hypothetical protein
VASPGTRLVAMSGPGACVSPPLSTQPSFTRVDVEPDIPAVAPTISHDPPDLAAAFGRAGLVRALDVVGQRMTAVVARPAGDLLGPCHALFDHLLGQLVGHICARKPG